MIFPYKNRNIDYNKKVRVYRNLNNGLISIKQGTLVVAHADNVSLRDVTFIVNEGLRQKVLKVRQKNVHAYVEGYLESTKKDNKKESSTVLLKKQDMQICYNPYISGCFRDKQTNQCVWKAFFIEIHSNGTMFYTNECLFSIR